MVTQVKTASKHLELSPRVQRGLRLAQEGRFQKKPTWQEGLFGTVLDAETVELPLVKRKALAIQKVLSEMPVKIMDHELVVGLPPQNSAGRGTVFPEYATREEREAARKNLTGTRSVFAHFTPSYPKYLRLGLAGLRRMAADGLDEVRRNGAGPEKEAWYESVIISLDGLGTLVRRYAELASELADGETDETRQGELREIARVSQHLLQQAPQSFHEAIQAVWFAHIAFHSTLNLLPLGRFDQNLWPYLKRDLEAGAITIDQAQDLIDDLWLRFNDRLQTYDVVKDDSQAAGRGRPGEGLTEAKANSIGAWSCFLGGTTGQDRFIGASEYTMWMSTMALAGLTPEGQDGTNPLTYLCINATYRLKMPQPTLYVRFHDGSPPELYQWVADCIGAGLSQPSIYNDEVIVPALEKAGIPAEHARDYTSDGCWEVHVQGRTQFKYAMISALEVLDRVLCPDRWQELKTEVPLYIEAMDPYRDSKTPDPYRFGSFDEVMASFKEHLDLYIKGFVEVADSMWDGRHYDIAPLPLLSAFTEGPLESGKDITQGGIQYVFHTPFLAGLSHVADSLAVVKKLCFEENVVGWPELLEAVRDNWEGKEPLRQLVRTRTPAYGNDLDYVDDIAKEIVEYYVDSLNRHSTRATSQTRFHPGVGVFEFYILLGQLAPASPDGRLSGEPIGSHAGPSMGRGVTGQTSAINSFLKLPLIDLPTGCAVDLATDTRSNQLLVPLIKSFVEERGTVLNISVNDVETLRAALKEPEKYRDLKVRVGGWEAFFVDLPPEFQQWQINKCEQYGT
ncbi:MAG: pyruvate formate lyase family protein [Dehalococcoidia bacterium]